MEPTANQQLPPPPLSPEEQELNDKHFNFEKASVRLRALCDAWVPQRDYVKSMRKLRYIEVNVESLQKQDILQSDETLIPIRVIDSNIRREQPAYVSYLRQSRRLAVYRDVMNPRNITERLEEEFTYGMTYPGWDVPFFRCLDGAQLHGWDFLEVEFDQSKPLHCGIDHIGNENMIFAADCLNIQSQDVLVRRYEVTPAQLRSFVSKYGFTDEQVKLLLATKSGNKADLENLEIYKRFSKHEGIVYVSWFTPRTTTDWLKAPQKLFLGKRQKITTTEMVPSLDPITGIPTITPQPKEEWIDVDETEYPVYINVYNINERKAIVQQRGRGFLDEGKQEAQTGLWSALVNGCLRASNVYGSPETPSQTGKLGVVDVDLVPGKIYSEPIKFWSTAYPDPNLIKAAQALDIQTQQETGQIDFAASNRQDSRKTATEISVASEQSALLSGVQVALYSTHLRDVFTAAWKIVQSQALQGLVNFCVVELQQMDGSVVSENDYALIGRDYDIRAAGDIDVIQRAEKLQKYQNFWPVVATTPIALPFLMDMLKVAFPDDAQRYAEIMQQAQQQEAQQGGIAEVLKAIVTDESGAIKPEFAQYEQQLAQVLQPPQQQNAA